MVAVKNANAVTCHAAPARKGHRLQFLSSVFSLTNGA